MKFWRLAKTGATILINGVGAAKAVTGSFKPVDRVGAEYTVGVKLSGTTPRVSLKVQASFDDVNFVIPDDMASAIITVADDARHVKAFSLTKAPFIRIQLDGDSSNGADTLVEELFIDYTGN